LRSTLERWNDQYDCPPYLWGNWVEGCALARPNVNSAEVIAQIGAFDTDPDTDSIKIRIAVLTQTIFHGNNNGLSVIIIAIWRQNFQEYIKWEWIK
jgi:hypothetical protein